MTINRISYNIKSQQIIIWDNNGKTQNVKFSDYYFISSQLAKKYDKFNIEQNNKQYLEYDTYNKLKKVYYNKKNRKQIEKIAYQSDMAVELKYLLDNHIEFSDDRHIGFFDIETFYDIQHPETNNIDYSISPIISIVLYSNKLNKYFVIYWHYSTENNEQDLIVQNIDDDKQYYICKNEKIVLDVFCDLIKELNIDIITGWFSHGYDVPYIIKRLCYYYGNANQLSPIDNTWMSPVRPKGYNDRYAIKIAGLDTIDLMELVQKLNYNFQNNKLDTAAKVILNDEKIKTSSFKDWQNNLDGFLEYAIKDVELLKKIDDKLQCINFAIQLQILSAVPYLNDIISVTKLIDSLLFKTFWDKNIIFPNNKPKKRVNYKGAIVMNPAEPGVHNDVYILDYSSLYPTTIMAFNISPETYLFSAQEIRGQQFNNRLDYLKKNNIKYIDSNYDDDLIGKRYIFFSHAEHIGVIPQLVKELYELRKKLKNIVNTSNDQQQKMIADKRQYAIKIILNSIYGAMGFEKFRLYKPECADSITYFGRKALLFANEYFSHFGNILYMDTDSIFIKLFQDMNANDLFHYLDVFNKSNIKERFVKRFNKYIDQFPEYCQMELKYQKHLKYIYFGEGKKRYYSIEDNGSKYIHGLNIIRKDTPEYVSYLLDILCQKAVKNELTLEDLQMTYNKIKCVSYDKIGIHKAFNKRFDQYNKNVPQHLSAVQFANEKLGLKIQHSDSVYLFYIKSLCEQNLKPKDRHDAICLRPEDFSIIDNNDKFEIDYDKFFEKQIIQPLREFDKIPKVKQVLQQYYKNKNDRYKISKAGEYVLI